VLSIVPLSDGGGYILNILKALVGY
jgi:hypothetical protein